MKWLLGIAGTVVAAGILSVCGLTYGWFCDVNKDRRTFEKFMEASAWRDYYLNGDIPEAPVKWPPKKK